MKPYLVSLHNDKRVNRLSLFAERADELDVDEVVAGYALLREAAPRRHSRNLPYLGDRDGVTSSGSHSNRWEEHLAVALCAADRQGAFALPNGVSIEFIDYQTPLKARRDDHGIGKVDVLAVVDKSTLGVVELKVRRKNSPGDTPLKAYLEGLAYCAIVEANATAIGKEVERRSAYGRRKRPPVLLVMAPEDYWQGYFTHRRTGDWWPVLQRLADRIGDLTRVEAHFVALRDSTFEMGLDGCPPRLTGSCRLVAVDALYRLHHA